jgi:CheY-like chemotaxis protein
VVNVSDVSEGAIVAEELRAIALVIDGRRAVPPGMSTMPVICCPLPSNRQTAIALGAEDILVKPVSREKLLAAIDALGRPVRRLLVADDDPDMVRLLQRMLSTRAPTPECLVAHNGLEALQVLRSQPVDLVLLDLAMPGLNGRGVLDELAMDPTLMNVPVLIISAQEQDYTNLRLTGAIQVVRPNGFRLGEIMQTLESLLNALSPGWHQLETTASAPEEALAG